MTACLMLPEDCLIYQSYSTQNWRLQIGNQVIKIQTVDNGDPNTQIFQALKAKRIRCA
jgi:hypothetical protein